MPPFKKIPPYSGHPVDNKHIRIVKPTNSGSYFFNYKGYDSIVLIAVVNAEYEFIYVSVGCNGRVSDGGVFDLTTFHDKLIEHKLGLPCKDVTKEKMNFVFVADDAFSLTENILQPYPNKNLAPDQRIFNYRLSRARRTVETAFGILANRFRVFHTPINMKPKNLNYVVLAACTLHSFLRRHARNEYLATNYTEVVDTGEVIPGEWRRATTLHGLRNGYGHKPSKPAKENRDMYKNYFMTGGRVPWQDHFI